jgi:hypothetical protein
MTKETTIRCEFWSKEQGQQCSLPARGTRDGLAACHVHVNPNTTKLKSAAQVWNDYFTKAIGPIPQLKAA